MGIGFVGFIEPVQMIGRGTQHALPGSLFGPSQGTMVGLERAMGGDVHVWSQVKGTLFIQQRFDVATDPARRRSWRRARLCDLRKVYPFGSAAITTNGTWNRSSSHSTGTTNKFVGDVQGLTTGAGAYLEATVGRAGGKPYDLWIVHGYREAGGSYVRVDIDGSQDLVNVLTDPASLGYKAFSCVGTPNNRRRVMTLVATGLVGNHLVRCTRGANHAGNQFPFEAIVISGDIEDDRVLPPLWQPSTAYGQGDEVQWRGRYFCAEAAGTSGTDGPPEASGTGLSDGALTWNGGVFPSYHDQVEVDYASEREYAVTADIGGTETVIGGQTHGNDAAVSETWEIDGEPWDADGAFGSIAVGGEIELRQTSTWSHANDATMATADLTITMTPGRTIIAGAVEITTASVDLGYLYVGMMPAVRWDGGYQRDIFTRAVADGGHAVDLDDYAGQNDPTVSLARRYSIGLLGEINSGARTVQIGYGMRITAESVDGWVNPGAGMLLMPNVNSRPSASGGTDWQVKGYVNRATNGNREAFSNGDVLSFRSEHVFSLWDGE